MADININKTIEYNQYVNVRLKLSERLPLDTYTGPFDIVLDLDQPVGELKGIVGGDYVSKFLDDDGRYFVEGVTATQINDVLSYLEYVVDVNGDYRDLTISVSVTDVNDLEVMAGTILLEGGLIFDGTLTIVRPDTITPSQSQYYVSAGSGNVLMDLGEITDIDTTLVQVTANLNGINNGRLSTGTFGRAKSVWDAATGIWVIRGTLLEVNAALKNTYYTEPGGLTNEFNITVTYNDLVSDPIVKTINMQFGVPADIFGTTIPASYSWTEDTAYNFSPEISLNGTGTAPYKVQMTLATPEAGSLSVGTYGSSTSTYNATTGVWEVVGSLVDVNAALANLEFNPGSDYDQSFNIEAWVGTNDSLVDSGTIQMVAIPINDNPVFNGRTQTFTYNEDVSIELTGMSISDDDVGDTFVVTLVLSDINAGTLVSNNGIFNSGTLTITGSLNEVNTDLLSVEFIPSLDFKNNFFITTRVEDAEGLFQQGSLTMNIGQTFSEIVASGVNQAITISEDTVFSSFSPISFSVHNLNKTFTVTFTYPSAAGELTSTASNTVSPVSTPGSFVMSGTGVAGVADINTHLQNLSFSMAQNYDSSFNIDVSISDGVESEASGLINGVITATVIPVNDEPVLNNKNTIYTWTEDEIYIFNPPLSVTGFDSGEINTVSLNIVPPTGLNDADVGSLSATSGNGETFNPSTGEWSITGLSSAINDALLDVKFIPTLNFNEDFSIEASVSDGVSSDNGILTMNAISVIDNPEFIGKNNIYSWSNSSNTILSGLSVTNPENKVLTVKLTLLNKFVGSLSATSGNGETFNPSTGEWSIIGNLTMVNNALSAVEFIPEGSGTYVFNFGINTYLSDTISTITGSLYLTYDYSYYLGTNDSIYQMNDLTDTPSLVQNLGGYVTGMHNDGNEWIASARTAGYFYSTTPGVSWTQGASLGSNVNDVHYHNGEWGLATDGGVFYSSTIDGTFTLLDSSDSGHSSSDPYQTVNKITSGNNEWGIVINDTVPSQRSWVKHGDSLQGNTYVGVSGNNTLTYDFSGLNRDFKYAGEYWVWVGTGSLMNYRYKDTYFQTYIQNGAPLDYWFATHPEFILNGSSISGDGSTPTSVCYGNGKWVFASSSGKIVTTSSLTDTFYGSTSNLTSSWKLVGNIANAYISELIFDGTYFIAVTSNSSVGFYYTTDPEGTWTYNNNLLTGFRSIAISA